MASFRDALKSYRSLQLFISGLILFAVAIASYVSYLFLPQPVFLTLTRWLVYIAIPIMLIGYLGLVRLRLKQFLDK
ncbi:MAG: hypothetical protein CMF25_04100 [Kangiellaceae bacterium]|nr:hypothetical protein [Kangiellaceae bacterium]